jgi:glycosyltransferase involved in cell wall biosynthesis
VKPEFVVMIPAYNGGPLLETTLRSCLRAGLDPARIAVVMCDNGSDDGSYEAALALANESRGLLAVHRNERNLGRVGNWNRCLEVAESMGARFGSYLMVGDEWLPQGDALAIAEAMTQSGASLALARYLLVDESGRRLRVGRNFIRGPRRVVPAQDFVRTALREAALCFGPLQANVYRLDGPRRLRFDPDDPTHTDQRSTLAFLGEDAGSLLLWGRPFSAWKVHPGRFHMGMDVRKRLEDDLAMIRGLAATRGIELDERRLNVNLFLLTAREWAGRPHGWARIREVARFFRASPGGLHWGFAATQVFRRVVLRRFIS